MKAERTEDEQSEACWVNEKLTLGETVVVEGLSTAGCHLARAAKGALRG